MRGDFEYPGSSASVGMPEPTSAGRLAATQPEHRTASPSSGRSSYFTCRVAVAGDNEMVADLQAYLKLFCRRRALIEIGDHRLAVHFETGREAAIFSGLWTVWAAAGLVATSRCRHHDKLDRLLPNRAGEKRR
jgi:hypothetical protein